MIYVDRSAVPPPSVLEDYTGSKEYKAARDFFDSPEAERAQRRFDFNLYRRPEVRSALVELFHGKCAYCESRIAHTHPPDIEHFRPKSGVVESPDHPGYWWLAGEWDNLLVNCIDCGRVRNHLETRSGENVRSGKGNRFPLEDESQRAFKPGEEENERPSLLNPCTDNPEKHLVFSESGEVYSDTHAGNTTIAVLGLNRIGLVESRAGAARRTLSIIADVEHLATAPRDPDAEERLAPKLEELRQLMQPEQEYAALHRQLVRPFIDRVEGKAPPEEPVEATKQREERAKESSKKYQEEQADFSLNTEDGRRKFRSETRHIESIVLRDIKALRHLTLDLTKSQANGAPWLVLLGENSTGKSTVLQAVAMVLAGSTTFLKLVRKLGIQPADYIRNDSEDRSGKIEVKISGFPAPHKLTIHERWVEFESPLGKKTKLRTSPLWSTYFSNFFRGYVAQIMLLGYGATRLLPRGRTLLRWLNWVLAAPPLFGRSDWTHVDNLFHPFVALADAQRWLQSLSAKDFRRNALVLKDLLALDEEHELVREDRQIKVEVHGDKVPLRLLSDGYQSVVAGTVDILKAVHEVWPNPENAEGIVLLDEVGTHLHPRWKMRIVSSLRQALPGFQFLATSHEPLCLRGLAQGEVVVLRRDTDNAIVPSNNLPDPSGDRVDQLLTSRFFGLLTTYDPELERLFTEYYTLGSRNRKDRIQHDQEDRYNELKKLLKGRGQLGDSPREELMYGVIDELLAKESKKARPSEPSDLVVEAAESTRAIWEKLLDFSQHNSDEKK